jgi:hypothetical protein
MCGDTYTFRPELSGSLLLISSLNSALAGASCRILSSFRLDRLILFVIIFLVIVLVLIFILIHFDILVLFFVFILFLSFYLRVSARIGHYSFLRSQILGLGEL